MFTKLFLIVIFTLMTFSEAQDKIDDVAFINVGSFSK